MSEHTSTFPYTFQKSIDRERPGTRIEADALDRLRDFVAWLQAKGCPASLEQELTIAVNSYVASSAARFGLTEFPVRGGVLPIGRRAGVWKQPPKEGPEKPPDLKRRPSLGEGRLVDAKMFGPDVGYRSPRTVQKIAYFQDTAGVGTDVDIMQGVLAGDGAPEPVLRTESSTGLEVSPGVPMSPSTLRKISALVGEDMPDQEIADLLEVDIVSVRAAIIKKALKPPSTRRSGPVRAQHPRKT